MKLPTTTCFVLILTFGTAITISMSRFENAVLNATCHLKCSDAPCRDDCRKKPLEIKQLEKKANANATFICRDSEYIVLGNNPGTYVIESRLTDKNRSELRWSDAKFKFGTKMKIARLLQNASYEFRYHRVSTDGISKPEITGPFETMLSTDGPEKVKNISLKSFEAETENPHRLRSQISFSPSEDYPCFYHVFMSNVRNEYRDEEFVNLREINFVWNISNLEFDMDYTVHITAHNYLELGSGKSPMNFKTPTCLEYYENLTICAPDEVRGLNAVAIHKFVNIFDVNVTWEKPNFLPDNYIVLLLTISKDVKTPLLKNISGTATETLFSNVQIFGIYDVGIESNSLGGQSQRRIERFNVDEKDMTTEEISPDSRLWNIMIILISSSGLAVGSIAYAYRCCKKRKEKKWRVEYSKTFYQKESAIEATKNIGESGTIVVGVEEPPTLIDNYEIKPERLEIKQLLGSGAFGVVKLGKLQDDRGMLTTVAVKMLRDDPSEEDRRGFELEMKVMKSAGQHPNIVSLLGCCTIGPKPLLIVEYCSRGDLQSFLRTILAKATFSMLEKSKQSLSSKTIAGNNGKHILQYPNRDNDDNIRVLNSVSNCAYEVDQDPFCDSDIASMDLLNFGRQVATGMEFLSLNRIVHRDLAARNVLVSNDETVKISDFGLSRDIYQENVYKKQGNGRLPVKWMAIEALTHQVYSTYSDVWSFGVLLWEIVTLGSSPYPDIPSNEVLKRLKSGYRLERPANCSLLLYEVMLSCWQAKPRDRPTFTILREKLDKLICMAAENEYLELNDVSKDTPPEGEDSNISSLRYTCLPLRLTYINDLNESRTARQDEE